MLNIVNNYSTTIITIYQDVINNYEKCLCTIKQTEDELTDIEHEIELGKNQDMYHGYLLYKEIKDLRIKRRQAKEEAELLKDMYDYLKSQQGQAFKSKIQSIQGSSVKIRLAQESRTYQPRQRDDLTITDKHANVTKPFEQMLKEFNANKVTMQNGKLRK